MTNRQQAERKAMELFPDEMVYVERLHEPLCRVNLAIERRAAFMQCFDLMPTGSLPMTREECKGWIEKKYEESGNFTWNASTLCLILYDHLASLSSAAPAQIERLRKDNAVLKAANAELLKGRPEYKTRDQVAPSAPAPVGVTRESDCPYPESMFPELSDAKLKVASFAIEAAGISSPQYTVNIARFVWKQAVKALTAPVSSAAQPATGYSEAQVREAIRLAHQLNGYRAIKFTPDEIISSLNKKP